MKPIFIDSPEAAELKTVTGWMSRNGIFCGDDEKLARIHGYTHVHCECGNDHEKGYCADLWRLLEKKEFATYPLKPWDKSTVAVNLLGADHYFYDFESLVDYVGDSGISDLSELRLVHCDGHGLTEIDYDHWTDDLAEDGELPDAVYEALKKLNEAIRNEGDVCWLPSKTAVDLSDEQKTELLKVVMGLA